MDFDTHPIVLAVRSHLIEAFEQPTQVQVMKGSSVPEIIPQLHVAQFAPEGPSSPNMFVTCGSALYPMEDGRRIEGLMIARRQPSEEERLGMLRLLGRFALFPASQKAVFSVGDLIDAKEDLSKFCDMDSILMLPPLPFRDSFRTIHSKEGQIELMWLVPVFTAEAEYARKHGIPALLNLISAQDLDLSEPRREEANTLMAPEEAEKMAEERAKEAAERAKKASPKPRNVAKLKSDRKDVGKGSFGVEENAQGLKISRRGALSPAKKPSPAAGSGSKGPANPAGPSAGGPSSASAVPPGVSIKSPGGPRGPGPGGGPSGLGGLGRPGGPGPGRGGRGPVKFDLNAGGQNGGGGKAAQRPAPLTSKRKEPAKVLSPEEQEAERKKKIEALKEAARGADERAKARTSEPSE